MRVESCTHIYMFSSQDVLDSLQAKLGLKAMSHFSLVVEHVKSLKRNKLTLLNPRDTLAKVSTITYNVWYIFLTFFKVKFLFIFDLWEIVNPMIIISSPRIGVGTMVWSDWIFLSRVIKLQEILRRKTCKSRIWAIFKKNQKLLVVILLIIWVSITVLLNL